MHIHSSGPDLPWVGRQVIVLTSRGASVNQIVQERTTFFTPTVVTGSRETGQRIAKLAEQLAIHQLPPNGGPLREFAEIEPFGLKNQVPPLAKMYVIRIDRAKHCIDAKGLTARQLLQVAGKHPVERYAIFFRLSDGESVLLPPDGVINFMTVGLVRLMTLPLDQTEGQI